MKKHNCLLKVMKSSVFMCLLLCCALVDMASNAAAAPGNNHEPVVLDKISKSFKPFTGDLPDLLKRKLIRVLTIYSPSSYFISNGRSYGFEYSLLKDYERMLNKGRSRRDLQVVVEFIPVPANKLIPDLMAGWGDIVAAGLTVTPQRGQEADFTAPYLSDVSELLVSRKGIKEITDLKELSGRKVYVRPSSSYHDSLLGLNRRLATQNLPPVKIIPANEFLTVEDILEMVNAGIVDLAVADSHLAVRWANLLPDIKVHRKVVLRRGGQLAWMVRKNNPKLKASLNRFIKTHKKGTLAGNIYFDRYFKETKWLKNPLVSDDRARFSKYAPLFKKYGEKYDIDWVLIAAQAYQESGLDPHRRSRVGAMGLMQIMPSLARDRRIGIKDLHLPENNVHAGVKYLSLIRDTHFSHSAMKKADRIRFSLAAYNAGPAKIKKARSLAVKMGYNANKWFKNGEMGALKLVGQQPVRYVSNINKYYIAYWLSNRFEAMGEQEKKKLESFR